MNTAARPLGIALVGIGAVAETHARALAEVAGARLVAVQSRDAAKARAFAARHGVAFATSELEALLARPDVDVVGITTPSGAHLEPALAAARAGKHLVIEKPLEITGARVDQLLDAAAVARVQVAPIFQARFGPGARALKQAIDAGRFGRLVLASAEVKWRRDRAYYTGWKGTLALDGGAALINQGIHAVDLLQWFAGMPEQVAAFTTRRVHEHIEGEDTVSATLRFRDGALGVIEATTAAFPGWQRRIEICGEHGSVMLEDDRLARWDFRTEADDDAAIRAAAASNPETASGASKPSAIGHLGHARQWQSIVDSLVHGAPLEIDGREGRQAVALIEAIYASAASGRVVEPARSFPPGSSSFSGSASVD